MKEKSWRLRLPYFFGQRNRSTDSSGKMPDESVWERAESGMEDILRWADDGGKMLDLENRTSRSDPDDTWKWRSKR